MAILAVGTVLSWGAWFIALWRLDPQTDGPLAVSLLLATLTLAVAGTLTIVGFFLRYWLEKDGVIFRQFAVAGRQAIMSSIGLLIAAAMELANLLHWWSAGFVIILLLMIELFWQAGEHRHQTRTPATPLP